LSGMVREVLRPAKRSTRLGRPRRSVPALAARSPGLRRGTSRQRVAATLLERSSASVFGGLSRVKHEDRFRLASRVVPRDVFACLCSLSPPALRRPQAASVAARPAQGAAGFTCLAPRCRALAFELGNARVPLVFVGFDDDLENVRFHGLALSVRAGVLPRSRLVRPGLTKPVISISG